jgi:hypothetical protein
MKVHKLEIMYGWGDKYQGALTLSDGIRSVHITLTKEQCEEIIKDAKFAINSASRYDFDYLNPTYITTPQQVPSSEPKAEDDIPF